MKRGIPRPQADRDVDAALSFYANENPRIARDFLHEVQRASVQISEMPGLGYPRLSFELEIENLRSYSLKIFPYVLIYFEREHHIDLVRVMHSHRDISTLLLGGEYS